MVGELLHAGALAATALSTCCVAASRPRARVREFLLSSLMFVGMLDIVLAFDLLAPVWWAGALIAAALVSVLEGGRRRSVPAAVRSTRAMDALGGILMAALMLLMSSGTAHTSAHTSAGHSSHGGSSNDLVWPLVAACALFAAASIHMAIRLEPRTSSSAFSRVLGRLAPLAMGGSVVFMAAAIIV